MDAALIDVGEYADISESTLLSLLLLDETITPARAASYIDTDLAELIMLNDLAMPQKGLSLDVAPAAPATTEPVPSAHLTAHLPGATTFDARTVISSGSVARQNIHQNEPDLTYGASRDGSELSGSWVDLKENIPIGKPLKSPTPTSVHASAKATLVTDNGLGFPHATSSLDNNPASIVISESMTDFSQPYQESVLIAQEKARILRPSISTPMSAQSNSPTKIANSRTTAEVIEDLTRPTRLSASSSAHRQGSLRNSMDPMPQIESAPAPKAENGDENTQDEYGYEDDNDVDDETQELPVKQPRKISERRRLRNAIIDAYLRKRQDNEGNFASSVVPGKEDTPSLKALIKQSESHKTITSPREYQIELFERAKERNIIAVLDTGSGKTMIAVLLLRHILAQELEDRSLGKPDRISFFLVDSVQLVFQQHSVLDANIDQKAASFCGEMGCDLWSKQHWEKEFRENMIIVCTAEVLYQCLHHSFISMDRINLLIFDEAHHAKKNHTYARIIKDFYSQMESGSTRPRIFGMTASPVDARVDVKRAAAELEALLHCEIATAADTSLLQYSVKAQVEQLARYAPLGPRFETPLYKEMETRLKDNVVFRKPLNYAYNATQELGAWCADQVWASSLTDAEVDKSRAKTERHYLGRRVVEPLEVLETRKANLEAAQALVKSHIFEPPDYTPASASATSKNLSSKVLLLVHYLKERYERPTDDKCIVFVKQRYTARLLAKLFEQDGMGTPYLRVGTLVGTRTGDAGDMNVSFRQQVVTMTEFRLGKLNCLFATSVAEEGLDIPDCNLVIRFDLYTTLIQYIQSRGRARHTNSRYIHMCEERNIQHAEIIKEVRKNEGILKRFCEELPEDRKLTGNDYDMAYFLSKEKSHRVYKVPETGAKLTYGLSLMVLANFVDSLPHTPESTLSADFVVTTRNKQFICEVILPEASPIRGAIGRPASTKQVAKCSAAFEMCILLRKGKFLDENLLPIFTKQLPAMRNAALAVDSKKREAYDMRTKPELWSVLGMPEELYLTVLLLEHPEHLDRPSHPLGILTRSRLPHLPKFPLHFGHGQSSLVECICVDAPLHLDQAPQLLSQINGFTIRFFDDIFSKSYESDAAKLPYFIVPIKSNDGIHSSSAPSELISWNVVNQCAENERLACDENTPGFFFANKFIVDPWDGSRKFWSVGVAPEFKPLDPVPPNTAPRPGARKDNSNIMEYSISLWQKARAKITFKENQPVIEANLIGLRRNLLDEFDVADEAPKKSYLIMEPLKISPIPTETVAMGYLFPAIIHRLESYLIALDACSMLNLTIRPDLALEALTKDSDNTDEHGEEQVNFQRGMGKNYERLEFLGDCFLKMATSISLYGMHPDSDEYQYHVDRMLLICNKNLRNNAIKLKLYEYVRSEGFNRRVWYPEGLVLLKGKRATASKSHKLGDKTIADVCEALIGAAYLSYYEKGDMDMAVRAVTGLVCSENHALNAYADYYQQYTKPKYQTAKATASHRDLARQVETKHSYHFNYPRVLRSAFVHPSYPYSYEHIPCYQRLEFLGDSLLDMVCVNFLFDRYPNRDPQWLTEHKMAMVSNQFLGALCVFLGFHKHLLVFNSSFQKQIQDYVAEITESRLLAEEEAVRDGKTAEECSPDYWAQTRQPPKCLPDIVEAYIGAIFVDSEYKYSEVERFFDEHIKWYFKDMSLYDTFANKHPVTFLSNFLQLNMGCSNFSLQSRGLPQIDGNKSPQIALVMIHNEIVAEAQGESGRYMKIKASKKAMEMLEGLSPAEFRRKFNCDCVLNAEGELVDEFVDEEDPYGTAI